MRTTRDDALFGAKEKEDLISLVELRRVFHLARRGILPVLALLAQNRLVEHFHGVLIRRRRRG